MESSVLSFERMSGKEQHDYGFIGVKYSFRSGSLYYRVGSEAAPELKELGQVTGNQNVCWVTIQRFGNRVAG